MARRRVGCPSAESVAYFSVHMIEGVVVGNVACAPGWERSNELFTWPLDIRQERPSMKHPSKMDSHSSGFLVFAF